MVCCLECGRLLRVDMSLHSDILFKIQVNQSLLLLLNAAGLAEKQPIPILQIWFDLTRALTHDLQHPRQGLSAESRYSVLLLKTQLSVLV
jgi:hypothetical protein